MMRIKAKEMIVRWEDLDRESKITSERARLREILKDVPAQQVALCERLIDRAAFMLVSLVDYEDIITRDGIVTEMSQGNYTIQRDSPAAKGYNSMIKNYQAIIKQLTDLLPGKKEASVDSAGDELARFIAKGKRGTK